MVVVVPAQVLAAEPRAALQQASGPVQTEWQRWPKSSFWQAGRRTSSPAVSYT
jgi:hypothetical protein